MIDSVEQHGKKWGVIAALLPGRSQAAVRNRWSRLLEEKSMEEHKHARRQGVEPSSSMSHDTPETSISSLSSDEHYKWRQNEDALIMSSVQAYGHKWRKIASQLPGRTEQAVRNRYSRLVSGGQSFRGQRSQGCWTKEEDACIMASVLELGHKWTIISQQRLPNRSEDAIRNRHTRLQRAQSRSNTFSASSS